MKSMSSTLTTALAILSLSTSTRAAEDDFGFDELSLEELTSLEVTSVSKRAERLSDAASAIYVITAEDLRRSGHTSVPEALRLVPGMQVERTNGSVWAISARGFEENFAGNLLVLIDGRTIYSALFGGTFWDIQTPPLDDIDRIEVIRGPGATLWGANAVNGVVNIITKKSSATQGNRALVRTGNEVQLGTELRHGFALGESMTGRISGMLTHLDPQANSQGHQGVDAFQMSQLHSRMDWTPREGDDVVATLGLYASDAGQSFVTFQPDFSDNTGTLRDLTEKARGIHGRVSWTHEFSSSNSVEFSGYFERLRRDQEADKFSDRTLDLGFQQNVSFRDAHQIVWGAGWRQYDSTFDGTTAISFIDPDETLVQYNLFAQDDLAITRALKLIVGSKLSWNDYTGWEIQPSVRTLWKPTETQSVWAAISRSVRTPARSDRNLSLVTVAIPVAPGINIPVRIQGSPDFDSEVEISYELGYRSDLHKRFGFDIALFASDYENLNALALVGSSIQLGNRGEERSSGAEVAFRWLPIARTKVSGSWNTIHLHRSERTPHQQWQLHAAFDLTSALELDIGVSYHGRRVLDNPRTFTQEHIGSHTRTDVRLGWKPRQNLSVALVAQDLFDRQHRENNFRGSVPTTQIERSVFIQAALEF